MATPERHREPAVALRPAAPADAELLQRWREEWSVRRFQPLQDLSLSQLRTDVSAQRIKDLYRGQGDKFQWIIEVDGHPGGWVTLVVANWEHGLAEVGYALATAWQGQRLMARALRTLLDDLFRHTAIERVEARCAVDNEASWRVLEKVGFAREGLLRSYFLLYGQRVDNYLYALLKDEWLSS